MKNDIRLVSAACVFAALAACGEATRSTSPTSPSHAIDLADKPGQERSALAELAQRDVNDFLNRRRQTDTSDPEPQAPTQPANQGRQIVWNDSGGAETSEPRIESTVELPEFQPSPLFRAAEDFLDEAVETSEPDDPADELLDRDRVRELVVELSKELYRDAAYADMPLRELFLIAATTLVSPDRALNPEAIPGLTARERDILREFQQFFAQLGRGLDGSVDADDLILTSIEALRSSLRSDPELELGTVALCTRVGGFGDYTPFNKNAFLAHAEQQAVVYIEVGGFTSEQNQRNEWVTELAQQLTIYSDRDGIPVWREDWQSAVDVSRNKRQDFFIVQIITLPKALSVGRYHLKLRLRDEKSGAEAEGTISFDLVADPKMAATVR